MSHALSAIQYFCVGYEAVCMFGNRWRTDARRLAVEYALLGAFWLAFYRGRTGDDLRQEVLWTVVLIICIAGIKIQILQWQRQDAATERKQDDE